MAGAGFDAPFVLQCAVLFSEQQQTYNGCKQHLLFLIVCQNLLPTVDTRYIDTNYPHGGKIGIGNSSLDRVFRFSKLLRLHAAFHDAFGLMKSLYNVGPGYCYAARGSLPNMCFLGHITGLFYWIKMYFLHKELFAGV